MDEAWQERHAMMPDTRRTVDEALEAALAGPAPFVVADTGDNTNGGTSGDSTELLRAALRREAPTSVLLSVCDAAAAAAATRAGSGARIELALGSGGPGSFNERVVVEAEVLRLFDGEYRHTHPVNRGYRTRSGPAALVRVREAIDVVVHPRIALIHDPALYLALGADPTRYDVVQAKSHVSFRTGFEAVTPRYVLADTPGPAASDLTSLPYTRRPVPLFPFEQ
jgi:microcystin degradation protein MlrC